MVRPALLAALLAAALAVVVIIAFGEGSLSDNITAATAVAALIVGGFTLFDQRRIHRLEVTYNYVQRLNSADVAVHDMRGMADYFILAYPPGILDPKRWKAIGEAERLRLEDEWAGMDEGERAEWKWALWEDMTREQKAAAVAYPNFLEELGGMYNLGAIDKNAAAVHFRDSVFAVWEIVAWFVERYRREARDPGIYAQWERMRNDLERRGPA